MTSVILHAGCGGEDLPPWFPIKGKEFKLDADEKFNPDVVASIDNMGDIGPFDAAFCCHCLEHLHWHDAMKALGEFHRVLKPGGSVFIEVPNLGLAKPDDTVMYTTGAGLEVTGMDMYFGHRMFSHSNPWMIHRCGFLDTTLEKAMRFAGFEVRVLAVGLDLMGVGVKSA